MHSKSELLALLQTHQLRLTKRLGQNYLVDPHTARTLVASCRLTGKDTVIEIGAGLGAITDLLAASAKRVIAVDVDRAIAERLRERMAAHPNVEVVCQDILTFPWERHPGCAVVGLIPYQITSPILVTLAEHASGISAAWLGMQREVAERLHATPGTKAYGRLTLLVQSRFATRLVAKIPRGAFFPQPAVDSLWIELTPRRAPAARVRDERLLFEVIRVAFAQRRKMLVNCLTLLSTPTLTREAARQALEEVGLRPQVRGEELSLEQFARLTEVLRARCAH